MGKFSCFLNVILENKSSNIRKMGGKNTKTSKKSDTPNDTVTLASSEQQVSTKKEKKVKEKKVKKIKEPKPVKEPKQEQFRPQVILPVNPEAEFANKEFLNDLSVFIMKAYDSQFRGSFNDYMVFLRKNYI